ncbi:LacI family DNA-binding transcriptional regulator [Leifsonia sp. 2MCAF36]|uniref:LacI family DNA-binding transcriptional regulator n=1 Tax=Leifsonia sp. 2MCAF36 TaxID=3232988 RepID=UPI003F95F83E
MSIQQVAKRAAVAPSTVSRYLNGTLVLKGETKARVDAALESTGYVHRPRAKRPKPKRRSIVGIIVPELTNPYFAILAEEIIAAADQQSLSTVIFSATNLPGNERQYVELTQRLSLDGLLYLGTTFHNEALDEAIRAKFPVVVVDEPQESALETHTVFQDDYSGAFQAVSYLVAQGHREIGFVAGSNMRTTQDRLRAYRDVLRQNNIDPDQQFRGTGSFTEEYGATVLAQIMASERRPTAVFVASDIIAVGLIVSAASMRIRIPGDLSVVGYDDIPAAHHLTPPLTTVRSPLPEMARAAVDLIIEAIEQPETRSRHVVVPVGMVIRDSTEAAPEPSRRAKELEVATIGTSAG